MAWSTAWAEAFDILAPAYTPRQVATWLNERQSLVGKLPVWQISGDVLLFEARQEALKIANAWT
jgi:hypothetical protein